MPVPVPEPWKPKFVVWPAPTLPSKLALANWIVPEVPLGVAFHVLVTVAPDGRTMVTVQCVIALAPAVTLMLVVKPPGNWLSDSAAVQPPGGGGFVGVVDGDIE